jgi:hypothetical protein
MDDGREIIRRVTTVLCPNGKYRYPVDYYDATEGLIEISQREREHLRIPGYKCLI